MVSAMTTAEERVETLEEVLQLIDRCAELLRTLDDPRVEAYCLADFEGRAGGWMGEFVRDILEQTLEAWREGDDS